MADPGDGRPLRFIGMLSNCFLYGVLVRSAACVALDFLFLFLSSMDMTGNGEMSVT